MGNLEKNYQKRNIEKIYIGFDGNDRHIDQDLISSIVEHKFFS